MYKRGMKFSQEQIREIVNLYESSESVRYIAEKYNRSVNTIYNVLRENGAEKKNLLQRFWEKVKKTENCWIWIGAKQTRGYGIAWWLDRNGKGKLMRAHRVSYEIAKGPIPDDMEICHICDNTSCVNPAHLWIGMHSDNMRDKISKNKSGRGENHYTKKQARKSNV